MRGQGSTEYIIILAVVLVLVMVSLSVMGVFSSMGEDVRTGESQSYWISAAQPFAIIDWKLASSPPKLFLRVQNKAGAKLTITSFNISHQGSLLAPEGTTPPITVQPGASIGLQYVMPFSCDKNKPYEFDASIGYNTGSISGLSQKGTTPLMMRCS